MVKLSDPKTQNKRDQIYIIDFGLSRTHKNLTDVGVAFTGT